MMSRAYYKVLREDTGRDSLLVSMHPDHNLQLSYPPVKGGEVTAKIGGLFIFTSQSDAVRYMRRNVGLYRLWLAQVKPTGVTTLESCPPDDRPEWFAEFWQAFGWTADSKKRLARPFPVDMGKLARPPRGTVITRKVQMHQLLYFQPTPGEALYEPTSGDLERVGWLVPDTEERRWW